MLAQSQRCLLVMEASQPLSRSTNASAPHSFGIFVDLGAAIPGSMSVRISCRGVLVVCAMCVHPLRLADIGSQEGSASEHCLHDWSEDTLTCGCDADTAIPGSSRVEPGWRCQFGSKVSVSTDWPSRVAFVAGADPSGAHTGLCCADAASGGQMIPTALAWLVRLAQANSSVSPSLG